jgi:hypothetical protein
MFSQFWQRRGEYLQAQILLIAQPVGTSLKDPDLVVQTFDETKGNLVLWFAIGGNAIPMALDHLCKLLIGFQSLPLEAGAPVLEEPSRPALALVAPELPERLLEEIGGIEPLVGSQQPLEGLSAFQAQVLTAGESRVYFWPLMKRLSWP